MTARINPYILLSVLLLAFLISSLATNVHSATFTANAVVLSKNQCRFLSNNVTLDFGNLIPISGATVNASTTVNFRCQGADPIAAYSISNDDGLHSTGPSARRMQHSADAAQFIPYSLSMNPLSGNAPKNVSQTLTIDGTINGSDYQFAIPGTYTDLVVVSILP